MTDFGPNSTDELLSIALQPDGKIVAVGTAGGQSALARYDVNGALDPTFGTGGKAVNAQPGECAPTSTIALTLRDGDVGDADRTANGVIVDQGGPDVVVSIPVVERPLAMLLGLLLFAIGARALRRVSRACS